jgi:Ni,Fe-hydrogenase I large subunit
LINRIVEQDWSVSGACDSAPLPNLSDAQLDQEMKDSGFIERPRWHGRCCETTSLTRVQSPLLDDLKLRFSNGLLVRLVARLHEVVALTRRMVPNPDGTYARPGWEAARPAIGIGQVAAARGQLVHRVELVGERVSNYRILAPTEWNFHPDGVLARALAALRGGVEQIEVQARLLINAIDPCVGYDLVVAVKK